MRLSAREFWDMCPEEFADLMERHFESIRQQFRPTSILAALYANAHLPEGQKVSAEDFIPGEAAPQGPPPELQAAAWKRFTDKHAGPKAE